MNSVTVISLLQQHRFELAEFGVQTLSLVGSVAREEATSRSDVDLAVQLYPGKRGFDHLDRMDRLKERLSEILGCPVDLIEEPTRSPRLQRAIEQDRVLAF